MVRSWRYWPPGLCSSCSSVNPPSALVLIFREKKQERVFVVNDHESRKNLHIQVPGSEVLTEIGNELTFGLPLSSVGTFPTLLESLDGALQKEEASAVAISMSSLEEAFMKLAEENKLC